MWAIVIFISVVCLLAGFAVNKANAKYLLSGYNTLPEEKRKHYDIDGYLRVHRLFFGILSLSIILGYYLVQLFLSAELSMMFIIFLPVISFPYLVIKAKEFDHSLGKKITRANNWAVWVFGFVFIGMVILFYFGLKDNDITYYKDRLEIGGLYGEEIPYGNIRTVELLQELPPIELKTNGFGLGSYKKGYFQMRDGEVVKLLINESKPPFLKIDTEYVSLYWNSTSSATKSDYYNIIKNLE